MKGSFCFVPKGLMQPTWYSVRRSAESGNRHASETFLRYGKAAKNHFKLLKNFDKQNLDSETVCYVCQVCGFIILDQHPEKCPVCNAVKKKVKKHE